MAMEAHRSPASWQRLFEGKTEEQCAALILSDLVGYRSSSKHRAEDIGTLENALLAFASFYERKLT